MGDLRQTLNEVRADGRSRQALCPAHEDHKPSLSISLGDDDRLLVHCHRGCTFDAVLAAAGFTLTDLFAERHARTPHVIVAEYSYRDEHGVPLYDAVRFAPKDFRLRRADGTWSIAGVRRVLYRLPELQGKSTAYIPEGEKDVDRVRNIGLAATTGFGGVGKWEDEYTAQLIAAGVTHVVVLTDNDEPGRQHGRQVAASCYSGGCFVKIVNLPGLAPKGDVSDWLDAGHTREELMAVVEATELWTPAAAGPTNDASEPGERAASGRTVRLTKASTIRVRAVRWLWAERLALGTFALLGGREGIGKSICIYTLAAQITRGRLDGVYLGTPKAVIVAATEDSWEHTIVPRLMAAGANLELIYRIDVATSEAIETALSMPRDLAELEKCVRDADAALILLDPLLSRLDTSLDSHKDAEVRVALEPLVALADRTSAAVVGLIHVNKSISQDPLNTLMASRAFAAVARTVLFLMQDPDNEQARLLGLAKNNLGRMDLPTLAFQIVGEKVADTAEGEVWTGRLKWTGETNRTIREALETAAATSGERTAAQEAADWLHDYLMTQGGTAAHAAIKTAGLKAGHSLDALKRARKGLGITFESRGYPRQTHWGLPQSEQSSGSTAWGDCSTALTAPTEGQSVQPVQSVQSAEYPQGPALTNLGPNGGEDDADDFRA